MCIVVRIRAVGLFPAGVRLCPVQTGVQRLGVGSFDFLHFSKEKVRCRVRQVPILPGEQSRSAPRCLREPTGCNQVCGAVRALLGLLVTCTQDTRYSPQ